MVENKSTNKEENWTKAQCLSAISQYEATCRISGLYPDRDGYQEWQKDFASFPSATTIVRIAPWLVMRHCAALADGDGDRARLVEERLGQTGMVKHWKEEDAFAALREYVENCRTEGRIPSFRDFTRWQRGTPGTPSIGTLVRVAPWSELLSRLQDEAE